MPQERLSSLGDTTTLGPEWLQRGIRTSNRAALDAASPKSGEARDRDGISPPAANYRYGRDQLLLLQSSMELPSPPRMANGRPKPPVELNALQQKFPVFGAMTKEHLVSEGVLPASTLEDKQVAGTLRGRAEGRGRGNKGRGKGGAEEAPHSPVQTSPGGSAVGTMGLPAPPLELPDRQVSGGGDDSRAGPRNPMSSFLDRVLKKGPAPAEPKAEAVPTPALPGLPPGAGLPPPTAALPSGESGEAVSPTARPPVPERPPPPPPGPGEAVPEVAKELPVRPGPLPSSPPQHPPTLGMAAFEPQQLPDPQPSPQRAPVNLSTALAAGGVAGVAAQAQALERELGLALGENLMAAQPQALQPGRVTAPQRQALPRLDDPSVAARLQEDMEEFEKGNCWYYKDPSGKIQGPFTTQQMRNWHQVGYFKSELPIRFKDGNFYRLDHLYPEAPFQQLPHTADPRAQAAQVAVAQAQAQAAQQAAAQQAQLQVQAAALARQRALLADPTLASSGFEYLRMQQAQAHAAQVNAQAQFATMKSLMGVNPAYGGYDDRRWPEELKALGLGGPSAATAGATAAQVAAAQLERERQQRLAALKEQQRLEQQRAAAEREHQRHEEQRIRLAQAAQAQAAQAAQQAAVQAAAAQQAAQQAAAPAKPVAPLVPPVPAPTMSPMEAAKEERKKTAQPKKPAKNDAPGPTQVAPGPVPKEAPPLIASPSEFPTLGGSSEEVVMTAADSSTGFWERPLRPVKVGQEAPIAPKADPKAKAAQKQQQKAKDEEKSEQRRAQVKELLTEYGITLEEPMVTFVMSVNGSSELSDYLEALKVTEKETARRFAEAFLAKGLVEKVEKTKEAPKRKHRIKGKEVDPSMLGFTAVPRGSHYES